MSSSAHEGRLLILAPLGSPASEVAHALVVRGYTPLQAEHPSAAAELLRSYGVDGIIVDAGWAAADPDRIRALRAAAPDARMIVVATAFSRAARLVARQIGVPCVEQRPGYVDDLCRALRPQDTARRLRASVTPPPGSPPPRRTPPTTGSPTGRLLVIARPGTDTACLADLLRVRGYAPVVLPSMEEGLSTLVHLVFDAVIVDVEHVLESPSRVFAVERAASRMRVIFTGSVPRESDRERLVWTGAIHLPPELMSVEEVAKHVPVPQAPRSRWRDTTRRILGGIKGLFTRSDP